MKNKKIIFLAATIVFTVIFAVLAVFVVPKRKYSFPLQKDKMHITVVGDSLFSNTGFDYPSLAQHLEKILDCEMQNCSIGGTTASKINKNREVDYYADKLNFYNVSDIVCTGNISSVSDNVRNLAYQFDDGYVKMKYLSATDLSEEDCLIICYGINDAFMRISASSDDPYDEYTYAGAMRRGIEKISRTYPDLKIIVCEITRSSVIIGGENDEYFDSVTTEYRDEYNTQLRKIADEYGNVYFFETNSLFEDTPEIYEKYYWDGIHFSEEGKQIYANALAEFIGELN
ncbi:MAG: SGNH/GDSL hydrolase family protein [Lachnospiraceae bacterium]|nr:SGNH/GDSL hydrolase family protein [Lachnospiraceae bacterium]